MYWLILYFTQYSWLYIVITSRQGWRQLHGTTAEGTWKRTGYIFTYEPMAKLNPAPSDIWKVWFIYSPEGRACCLWAWEAVTLFVPLDHSCHIVCVCMVSQGHAAAVKKVWAGHPDLVTQYERRGRSSPCQENGLGRNEFFMWLLQKKKKKKKKKLQTFPAGYRQKTLEWHDQWLLLSDVCWYLIWQTMGICVQTMAQPLHNLVICLAGSKGKYDIVGRKWEVITLARLLPLHLQSAWL